MSTLFDGTDIEALDNYLTEVDPRYFRDKPLYRILKKHLSRLGYWKNLARRTPVKGIRPTTFVGTSIVAQEPTDKNTTFVPSNVSPRVQALQELIRPMETLPETPKIETEFEKTKRLMGLPFKQRGTWRPDISKFSIEEREYAFEQGWIIGN